MTIHNHLSGPSYGADPTAISLRAVGRTTSMDKALRGDEGAPLVRCWYGQLTMSSLPEPKRRLALPFPAAVGAIAAMLLFVLR